ncbi:MAG: sigma-54-dependent Fis family transcriptional regulator [Desulfobacterales bacterium]|nr:sigma-54-dependent Fis family transcriptional regulator [Desulfobacterales bacterium]
MAKILIVDDESKIRTILNIMITSQGHEIAEASDGLQALNLLEIDFFDLVITDIRMDGLDGKGLLKEIKHRNIGCPVVFITAFATLESAIEAMRLGAVDYLVKPFEEKQVHLTIERALGVGQLMKENVRLKEMVSESGKREQPLFISTLMKNVEEMALKVADTDATVLITGESGSGKEVLAHLIHDASPRRHNRFVAVNCASFSPNLVESELFGHEKGAFTGANQRKEGKFEYANGGTLFLDEVGDLPLEAQAKLLRVIQEKTVQRVGGNQDIVVSTRLICATNQCLEKLVESKSFRQDLYYRLAVFPVHIPPLRERKKDVIPLSHYFIKKFAKASELSKDLLTPGAVKMLMDFSWPGNVRELSNVLERAMILKSGTLPITSDDLFFLRSDLKAQIDIDGLFKLPPTGINFEALQRDIVRQALELTSNNQSAAARLLGLSRARFRTLLKMLDEEDDVIE